jgi:hypothetical protein
MAQKTKEKSEAEPKMKVETVSKTPSKPVAKKRSASQTASKSTARQIATSKTSTSKSATTQAPKKKAVTKQAEAKKAEVKKAKTAPTEKPETPVKERRGQYPKSISRIETPKHSAWYVRIYYQGAYVRKTFSDNVYGGKDVAFHEALQWRDEMEKRMGKPRTDRSVRKKTQTGEYATGIHRRRMKDMKRGRTYFRDVFEVTWCPEPGKVWRTTVSVSKHGVEEAYRKALEIRREKEKQYFGGVIS